MKITNKIFIEGSITALTGFRIGGNKSSLEIGGVDLNVIKTGSGIPYIPGSSFKGKMRSLLAKIEGSESCEKDSKEIKILFGDSGSNDNKQPTRLMCRDAALNQIEFNSTFGNLKERKLDFDFTEIKTENTINRSSGSALNPRQIERVPAGAKFNFEILLDIYEIDDIKKQLKLISTALELINLDYIGGHGSRGSGRVKIEVAKVYGFTINDSEGIKAMSSISGIEYFNVLEPK